MRLCRNSRRRQFMTKAIHPRKAGAFLRVLLIHRKRSPFPTSGGRLLGARSPMPPLCKGGTEGGLSRALRDSCFHWIGNNPSVSLRDPPSLLALRSRFVAAEDRALPARRHLFPTQEGRLLGARSPMPPLCKGGTEGGLSRGINAKKDGAFCAVPFGCLGDYSIVMLCVSGSFGCSAFGNSRVRTPFSYLHLIDSGRMSPT